MAVERPPLVPVSHAALCLTRMSTGLVRSAISPIVTSASAPVGHTSLAAVERMLVSVWTVRLNSLLTLGIGLSGMTTQLS